MKKISHISENNFFATMSFLCAVTIFFGFASTYGMRFLKTEPVPPVIHFHAATFSLWVIIFVAQTVFIIQKKIDAHKKMGVLGFLVGLLMLNTGLLASLHSAKANHLGIPGAEFPTFYGFFLLNISSLSIFMLFLLLGYALRDKPDFHKRFLLMALVAGLTPPGIARVPLLAGSTTAIALAVFIFLLAPPIFDFLKYKKLHRAYIVALPFSIFILPPVVKMISTTNFWIRFTNFLILRM